MEKELSIYKLSEKERSEIISDINNLQRSGEVRRYGKKLNNIINSYDPVSAENKNVFQSARTVALGVNGYFVKTSQVSEGCSEENSVSDILRQFVGISHLDNPLRIAHGMSNGCMAEKNGVKFLLGMAIEVGYKCLSVVENARCLSLLDNTEKRLEDLLVHNLSK